MYVAQYNVVSLNSKIPFLKIVLFAEFTRGDLFSDNKTTPIRKKR